jgi:hypothetical protein
VGGGERGRPAVADVRLDKTCPACIHNSCCSRGGGEGGRWCVETGPRYRPRPSGLPGVTLCRVDIQAV